jgi:hypothetical protein
MGQRTVFLLLLLVIVGSLASVSSGIPCTNETDGSMCDNNSLPVDSNSTSVANESPDITNQTSLNLTEVVETNTTSNLLNNATENNGQDYGTSDQGEAETTTTTTEPITTSTTTTSTTTTEPTTSTTTSTSTTTYSTTTNIANPANDNQTDGQGLSPIPTSLNETTPSSGILPLSPNLSENGIDVQGGSTNDTYLMKVTIRDTTGADVGPTYANYVSLTISLWNGTSMTALASYFPAADYQYGQKTYNLTPAYAPGSRIYINSSGLRGLPIMLKDIRILHNGMDMAMDGWNRSCSRGATWFDTSLFHVRADVHADDWVVVGPANYIDVGDYSCLYTNIKDGSDLRIMQAGLTFNKTIWNISTGNSLQINVTVNNTGYLDDNNANITLYINDTAISSRIVSVKSGSYNTTSFPYTANFIRPQIKVSAKVYASGDTGMRQNQEAVKYLLKHPFFWFTNSSQTYVYSHRTQAPYSTWISDLNSQISYCNAISVTGYHESTKAACAMSYAQKYQLNKSDTSNANKAMYYLGHIGDYSSWVWANWSLSGNCAAGSGTGCSNQNYGAGIETSGDEYALQLYYAIAYDWAFEYMKNYPVNLTNIRDRLGRLGAMHYLINKEPYSYTEIQSAAFDNGGDYGEGKIGFISALGPIAFAIADYDGQYQNLDGSPDKWMRLAEQDQYNYSMSGGSQSILNQFWTKEGVYEEGSGYRAYYLDEEWYYASLYPSFYGRYLTTIYPMANESPVYIPAAMSPVYLAPMSQTSYSDSWVGQYVTPPMYPINSTYRMLMNYYIRNALVPNFYWGGDYPYHLEGSMDNFEKIFTYDASEAYAPVTESYRSSHNYYSVVRGSWSPNAVYAYMRLENESGFSGHMNQNPETLTFDVFGRGAYLISSCSDPRFMSLITQFGGIYPYCKTSWDAWEPSATGYVWMAKEARNGYDGGIENPGRLLASLQTPNIKMTSGRQDVTTYLNGYTYSYTYPFNATRRLAVIGDRYLVDFTRMESASNSSRYRFYLPFGSASLHTGTSATNDNYVVGNMTIDGTYVPFYNYGTNSLIQTNRTNVTTIIWNSPTIHNSVWAGGVPVNLTVYLNPRRDLYMGHYGEHFGRYGEDIEAIAPYVFRYYNGSRVNKLDLFYIRNGSEENPSIGRISIDNGGYNDYADYVNTSSSADVVWETDGAQVGVSYVKTDSQFGVARKDLSSGEVTEFLFGDGTYLNTSTAQLVLLSSRPSAFAYYKNGTFNYQVRIANASGTFVVRLKNLANFVSFTLTSNGVPITGQQADGNTTVMFNLTTSGTTEATLNLITSDCTWENPPPSGAWSLSHDNTCLVDLDLGGPLAISNRSVFTADSIRIKVRPPGLTLSYGTLTLIGSTLVFDG